jgi:aspartate racemase
LRLVADGRMTELVDYLGAEIERLARAGAGCALLAANTPHVVFDELRARSPRSPRIEPADGALA